MDELSVGLDADELMDLDEGEGSELEDDEEQEELIDDTIASSPLQLLSSGPASTATSVASSPPNNEEMPPMPFNFNSSVGGGKPLSIKRGRGRPRREGGKPIRRGGTSNRARRVRSLGITRGGSNAPRRFRQYDGIDFNTGGITTPSPLDSGDGMPVLDPETGNLVFPERDRQIPIVEDLPYAPEQWPGKVCAFCNLSERSQLGQGELLRLNCGEGFVPQKNNSNMDMESLNGQNDSGNGNSMQIDGVGGGNGGGDKSPRGPVTCRRQKSFNKCRHPSLTSEYVDELTIIGYNEEPDGNILFESNAQFYVHRNCALWSFGVKKNDNSALENVDQVVLDSSSKKCSFCNHFGASLVCKMDGCSKMFHFPCATASGAFQELSSLTTFCSQHLGQATLSCESSACYTCKSFGDIANLMYCSSCGTHYHGTCVGLAQLPGVRSGWQCRKCRICQVCRMTGDETKLMTCEQCDKIYHASCQRPIVTSIPKYGWKCRCCRVCGDCGSRTPGAGLSSRWHAHYTVCDSCYQQRNKGFSCPLCHRAYRSHAHREMVQCTVCRKFVHGTCDPDADLTAYHQRKEVHPEYEYVCYICKNANQPGRALVKRSSTDDPGDLSASQESLVNDDSSEYDFYPYGEDSSRTMGLGKGKPYCVSSKIAKKRLGFSTGLPGRPKGIGKGMPVGKVSYMKRQKLSEFGRKRGPKSKMRGIFGVPGVGLQRPVSDGKNDEEPGTENRLVLCSAKDKFVLTQDVCVMCGALGTDQEGCLLSCVQCGQCYHPYCVNIKVTKVILQKGWRCLDCTVCEGCGLRHDEHLLILCDDCDITFHIYCMDPPLKDVPQGNWKCKWCAICQTCGATDPGFNCNWMNSCTECGPCASHINCPSCAEPYSEGDLIIQCVQCERWLHGQCDNIKTEEEAEKCADEGYNCLLCRPRDVPPPHLLPLDPIKPPTPTKSPEMRTNTNFFVDGVCLSESGHCLIKSLSIEHYGPKKKRKKLPTVQDKEAGIMATIESVIAGGNAGNTLDENAKLELVDLGKDEPQELYKEGMIWTKEDGTPPEGFTIYTMENGVSVLRRKRQRNLQKLGIGGFLVRMRGIRGGLDNDEIDILPGQNQNTELTTTMEGGGTAGGDKPMRRKPIRRKIKSKLVETFPPYLQEAFFGKDLMDGMELKKMMETSDSDEELKYDKSKSIQLNQDELRAVAAVSAKQKPEAEVKQVLDKTRMITPKTEEEEEDNAEDLNLAIPGDLLDADLMNIINDGDINNDELTKNTEVLGDVLTDSNLGDDSELSTLGNSNNSKDTKDELSDILGSHFNLEAIRNINSKDVEDIFKGVLTDESQESQESNIFPIQSGTIYNANATNTIHGAPPSTPQHPSIAATPPSPAIRPITLQGVAQKNLNSPLNFPPQSPYNSEFSNSPQFSPAFSEPPSPWVSTPDSNYMESADIDSSTTGFPSTHNQRSSEKMKADEGLGNGATISAVLYANINHPEWKTEFKNWSDRYKQIIKKWRTLTQEQKQPYLQQARDNRSQLRMKKAQQDQEKIALQQKSAREAEQERAWKALQAHRQQQQHVMQARVHRQLSDPNQFVQDSHVSPIQVTTPTELSPAASPSPGSRQFIGIKSPPFIHPQQILMRTPTPSQSPAHEFQQPQTLDNSDPYAQQVPTPKPPPPTNYQAAPTVQQRQMAVPPLQMNDFSVRSPQFIRGVPGQQVRQPQPEVNRQLRDLLQFKKVEDVIPGKGQHRIWPPTDGTVPVNPSENADSSNISTTDGTFRQPLPPPINNRPRLPQNIIRGQPPQLIQQGNANAPQIDPKMRLLLQQQQQQRMASVNVQQTQFSATQQPSVPTAVRFANINQANRPATVEQYEQLLQRQTMQFRQQQQQPQSQPQIVQRPPITANPVANAESTEPPEIPDNVTAELEKLEQESGGMVELHGVSDILGGLEDDDELLAEMGADFNILEYADPELEALAGGKANILDLELEEEPIKKDQVKTSTAPSTSTSTTTNIAPLQPPSQQQPQSSKPINNPNSGNANLQQKNLHSASSLPANTNTQTGQTMHPPPQMSPSQQQQQQQQMLIHQHIHQQMLQQMQQAAAEGRPMPPGSRLQTNDGIVGIVMPNNNVQLQIPPNYHQRFMQNLQNKQQMQQRLQQQNPRMMAGNTSSNQGFHVNNSANNAAVLGASQQPRMAAAPPPPPYPGPPPPYPGINAGPQQPQQQQQEQPLLLEDLLEQEKREQEKQQQSVNQEVVSSSNLTEQTDPASLLPDPVFERLRADVFNNSGMGSGNMQVASSQNNLQQPQQQSQPADWQQNRTVTTPTPSNTTTTVLTTRVQVFNANLQPAPPLPPENIVTEQDKQVQKAYEHWLNSQNNVLQNQLRYYDGEVQKLRKLRKSLNSKQRQLRKSGNSLTEPDATELQRITSEMSILQKHLETSRKQSRQHSMLVQEYRSKQQAKQIAGPGQSPLQQMPSPLGPPASSPIHHPSASQSPMMSPSAASPLTQHNSPMHSPGPIVSHSPSPGSVNLFQNSSNVSPMQQPSPLQQPSPRIGTPQSQGEGSPGPVQSPSQVCLPPPVPRMTSPQQRRVVTSPVGMQPRYIRTQNIDNVNLQQRVRMTSPLQNYTTQSQQQQQQQRSGGITSPLNSPPPQSPQPQILQKQLLMQQQLQQQDMNQENIMSQRTPALMQQRSLIREQLQQQTGQPQQMTPQQHQMMLQQQQQLAKQQQQQIAQLQARMNQQQQQQSQQNLQQPQSPMPPKSPMIASQQIMSPHSMPTSPMQMPPRSPMVVFNQQQQNPNSPAAPIRSPFMQSQSNQPPSSPMMQHQYQQPPSSPMPPRSPMIQNQSPIGMRRPPSGNSSPMPDRPTSVENPKYKNMMEQNMEGNIMTSSSSGSGSGNINCLPINYEEISSNLGLKGGSEKTNSTNIPSPTTVRKLFGRFGTVKLGLRGGAPMWKGAKRVPTPPISSSKNTESDSLPKPKKESHLSKVSILKKKSSAKTNLQSIGISSSKLNSLVSTDYNEFDDSSSTPPVTPPPSLLPSTSKKFKKVGESIKIEDDKSNETVVIVDTIDDKQPHIDFVEQLVDYDDDNTVLSAEVSLSSAAPPQTDGDEIEIETISAQNDLGEGFSSPLEPDQIPDEYLLFPGNMMVDISGGAHSDKEEEEVVEDFGDENMHIVIRSPTTSDDEFIMQDKSKKYNEQLLMETPESPDQEEMNVDPQDDDEDISYEDSEIVILDSKDAQEEQISTKEDFEELIDEGTKNEKILKPEIISSKNIEEFHKYAASFSTAVSKTTSASNSTNANTVTTTINVVSLNATTSTATTVRKVIPKTISLITTTPIVTKTDGAGGKVVPKVASLFFAAPNSGGVVRGVMPKVVVASSVATPAITIVSASSQISQILPSKLTVPVISASAVRQLPNVRVIDKPSTSLSLTTTHDNPLPKKIFEDDSISPDSSNCEEELKLKDSPNDENLKVEPAVKIEEKTLKLTVTSVSSDERPIKVDKLSTVSTKTEVTISTAASTSSASIATTAVTSASKITSPVIIHNPPELKMTAQIIQESQTRIITTTAENVEVFDGNADDKSVVISIPSPTPSQEQMLDNIALQALENRRRDGKGGISSEFDSFDDVLDMIENITADPSSSSNNSQEKNTKEIKESSKHPASTVTSAESVKTNSTASIATNNPVSVEVTQSNKLTGKPVPQLSPLSQPSELTSNMANASQQLRTLLSMQSSGTTLSSTNTTTTTAVEKRSDTPPTITSQEKTSTTITTTSITSASLTNSPRVIVNVKKPIITVNTTTSQSTLQSTSMPTTSNIQSKMLAITSAAPFTITTTLLTKPYTNILTTSDTITTSDAKTVSSTNSSTPSTNIIVSTVPFRSEASTAMTTTTPTSVVDRKPPTSLSLTAMLQNQPAATPTTKTSADTITAASILGTPISLSKGFSTALVQAQPNVVVSPVPTTSTPTSSISSLLQQNLISSSSNSNIVTNRTITTTTNLLHTQLTKAITPTARKPDDTISKEDNKEIPSSTVTSSETSSTNSSTATTNISFISTGCKYSSISTPTNNTRSEDSQNVLLKQLLQNMACASTQTTPPSIATSTTTIAPTTQASDITNQAAPTLSSLLPSVSKSEQQNLPTLSSQQTTPQAPQTQKTVVQRQIRETSFVSSPIAPASSISSNNIPTTQMVTSPQILPSQPQSQPLHVDVKKCLPPSRTPSRDEMLSPPTPRSSCSQDSSLQTPPLIIKKEISMPGQVDVKKEFMDESSQHSEVSDHSRGEMPPIKDELLMDSTDIKPGDIDKEELKKQKRRMYQQKRRQNLINNKEASGQPVKKRPRKNSRLEEDYDSYIDGVLAQLRTLPPMSVSEPILSRNYGVVPVYGSGDMSKLGTKDYDSRYGDLVGTYGNAMVPGYTDFYNTKPYGDLDALPEKPPTSTQRGFYDQEFPPIRFDTGDRRFDLFCREDTPTSIISSSSPECVAECDESNDRFFGLKLISDDEEDEEREDVIKKERLSPVVPIIAPIPIKLKPSSMYLKDYDKENIQMKSDTSIHKKYLTSSTNGSTPLKDSGNVTVTLTLTSSAAEDIMGVLRDLANILHIPAPTSYQIVERTTTPPSQKLGLYRTKGKDGKEGAPIDIQSILNGAAKFCKHCDVVILNNMIRRKISDLPFLAKDTEILSDGEELYFCSSACYIQFASKYRSPSMSEDKAAETIDYLSKDMLDTNKKKGLVKNEMCNFKTDEYLGQDSKYNKSDGKQSTHKNVRYKFWGPGCLQPPTKYKKPTDKEIMELLYRLAITVTPPKIPDDTRKCMFCHGISDGVADGPARLLNIDVDKWVHLNCGLWSDGVYETVNGALMNLENAIQQSLVTTCVHCNKLGATIRCFKARCTNVYHLGCAVKDGCVFFKSKVVYCTDHVPKNEKDNELTTLSVSRRVYVNRDENRQVAAVMHHSDTNNLLRVGSLIFLNVGQLLPHQLQNFHSANYIYPIGYKIIRFYWSMRRLNKRCRYICSIHDVNGRPEFRVLVQEPPEEDVEFKDQTAKAVWTPILEQIAIMRKESQCVQLFPRYVTGEDLFGLTEPAVVRVLESLPGIETLTDYKFKYGRNPLLELPLAINPSGAARTEPRLKNQLHWKRPHTQRTAGASTRPMFGPSLTQPSAGSSLGEMACPYSKQFVHSKSSQYKKMKQEWRNNVYLARSKIQGLGLYAARDLEKHTMVIEYIGEIIRTELAECREKQYEAKNRGIYMFRLDEERVVDATLCGGLARYINHSCNPNCVAETVEVDRDFRIIIFAKRRIQRGEELAYDYKFDIEDDQHKISCMCGAPNCRKWMN